MFGNSVKSFKDESYYLGEFDNNNNPIKSKLTIADIENMLNQQNYIYPEQEDFDTKITGSVSDYFKSVTRHQIDLNYLLQMQPYKLNKENLDRPNLLLKLWN